jgi:hypothetical protein
MTADAHEDCRHILIDLYNGDIDQAIGDILAQIEQVKLAGLPQMRANAASSGRVWRVKRPSAFAPPLQCLLGFKA